MNLFDDDDDDDVLEDLEPEEFDLKLEEKLGRSERTTSKLIELQSKFAHDPRFKISENFLNDDDKDVTEPKTEIEEEKSKNLAILEQVLGKRIHSSKPVDAVSEFRKKVVIDSSKRHSPATPATIYNSVLTPRFDPTKTESKIYELESTESKKRKVNIDFDKLDQRDAAAGKKTKIEPLPKPKGKPEKSADLNENYYEVNTNLKEIMTGAEDFSLGDFLGLSSNFEEPAKALDAVNKNATYEIISKEEKKKLKQLRNPFKYDSSDDEDDLPGKWDPEKEDEEVEDDDDGPEIEVKVSAVPRPPHPLLSSSFGGFFFSADDARLKEELFYAPELIEKAKAAGKERSILMMRAFSLRKKAAQKNQKSCEKFAKKRKILRQNAKRERAKRYRRNFNFRRQNDGDRRRPYSGGQHQHQQQQGTTNAPRAASS